MARLLLSGVCFLILLVQTCTGWYYYFSLSCPLGEPCQCFTKKGYLFVYCHKKNLNQVTLPQVSAGSNSQMGMVMILSKNKLVDLPQKYFSSIQHNIVFLFLHRNKLNKVPTAIKGLTNLHRLSLHRNKISQVSATSFSNLPNLKVLDLGYNKLKVLKHGSFKGLKKLLVLLLDKNRLTTIESDAFADLEALLVLHLGSNRLKNTAYNIMQGMPNLLVLKISKNKFKSVPNNYFKSLGKLRKIYMERNRIKHVERSAFTDVWDVSVIDLALNNIASIEEGTFDGLDNLMLLDLSFNKMAYIPKLSFYEMKNMSILLMDSNPLKTFPDGFFHKIPHTMFLGLSGLPISNLPNITSLKELEYLSIYDTNITKIYPCEWEGLVKLKLVLWGENLTCDCDMVWLHGWYQKSSVQHIEKLDNKDCHHFLKHLKWNCSSPANMKGKAFKDISPSQLTCPDRKNGMWCDNTPIEMPTATVSDVIIKDDFQSMNVNISNPGHVVVNHASFTVHPTANINDPLRIHTPGGLGGLGVVCSTLYGAYDNVISHHCDNVKAKITITIG